MILSLRLGLYRKAYKLDRSIRLRLDKILPRNLTVRYIAALTAVGILATSGQLIMQASLARQGEEQRKIRAIESQIRDSENLRKAILSLQLSSHTSEVKDQIGLIESLALQFEKSGELLNDHSDNSSSPFHSSEDIALILHRIQASLAGIVGGSHALSTFVDSKADHQLSSVAFDLLNNEAIYRTSLKELSKFYNQRLERQIREAKRIELFLLFITLFVLVIEGLYVFRPEVESLYDALRIRSDFLGRMGHEMRNPMNSILGMTNLLFETPLTEQQKKYLSILQKSSVGLLEVLNNLLDFSSIESGTLKMENIPFDLDKLLERSIDLSVFGAHANGIELVLDLGTNVPLKLTGDPGRLQQILTNLLGNAVKFTKKGEVTLKVELQRLSEQAWIQFAVIDTGMGIDKQKIDRIFDAFVQEDSTVRRRFGGTGLGLSISKDLVSLLGGTLSVESKKNVGSRFYFTIPFTVSQDITVEDTIRRLNLGTYDALTIEPNEAISETLSSLIKKSGGTTHKIGSFQPLPETFSQISQAPGKKEVIIIDYEFSRESLTGLFSRIRRRALKPEPFVFLIKTTASSADIERLAENGIRNFLFKPVKPLQLIEAIAQGLYGYVADRESPKQEQDLIHDSRPLRVLAVDDSKDNQFLVKAYLASLPYRLTFADNGRIAVDKFKTAQFDIILMDLQMPEMDGYTATQLIREWETVENLPPTPVVAVSAHDNESGSDRFRKSQFSSYLVKPISPNQLRQTILDFTQSHRASNSPSLDRAQAKESAHANSQALAELEKQLAELAPQYLKSRTEELKTLRTLLSAANYKEIQTLGHRLKGNAKSYGFEELGKIGAKLEDAARNQDGGTIHFLIHDTETYLNQFSQSQ